MKAITLTILLLLTATKAVAQKETCVTNRNAPPINAYYWPPDTTVKVHFASRMFTSEQRATLLTAMKTWSEAAANAGAGITFTFAGETQGLLRCQSSRQTEPLKLSQRSLGFGKLVHVRSSTSPEEDLKRSTNQW